MKKRRIFPILLCAAVLTMTVVLAVAYVRGGQHEESEVTKIAAASIPTVTMNHDGQAFNCLQGYTAQMDPAKTDTVLTPLGESKSVTFLIGTSDKNVTSVDYTIYRSGGTELVENRHTDKLVRTEGGQQVTVDLSGSISSEAEYLLEIKLLTDEAETIRYYTRVAARSASAWLGVSEALTFAEDFCRNTFAEDAGESVAAYLETDGTEDNESFAHVSLHSSFEQVTWGDLEASLCEEPVVNLLEMDDSGAVMSIDYQMSAPEDEETNSYYLVHEYYRIYKNASRICLMEFARDVTETFVGTKLVIGGQSVTLGIVPENVEYAVSKNEEIVVWEQAGELWQYQPEDGKLYKIFTLQDTNKGDKRAYMQDYDIHILNVSNNGNVDFVVSGYANRGPYEGACGLQLCRYTERSNMYEVLYAVTDDRDAALVCEDVGRLSYLSGKDFYYYLRGTVWHVNLDKGEIEALADGLDKELLAASSDGRYVSWASQDAAGTDTESAGDTEEAVRTEGAQIRRRIDRDCVTAFTQMDLEKGKKNTIAAEEGEYLRAIGYVNADFVYGKARAAEIKAGDSGYIWFPMYTVVISDSDGEIIKEYADESMPVVGGYTTDEMIHLERVLPAADGGYAAAQPHQIVSALEEETETVLETFSSEARGKQVRITLPSAVSASVHRYTAEESGYTEAYTADALEKNAGIEEETAKQYYLFENGRYAAAYTQSNAALEAAESKSCILKNEAFETIYCQTTTPERMERDDIPAFDGAVIGADKGIAAAWQTLEKQKTVLDATGISFDMGVLLAGQGSEVLMKIGAGQFVLLTGYDEESVTVYDVQTGQSALKDRAEAEALYVQYGSICVVCK